MFNTDQAARERREARARHYRTQEEIIERCEAEKRNLNADEKERFDTAERAMKQLDRAIRSVDNYQAGAGSRAANLEQSSEELRGYGRYLRTGETRATGWSTSTSDGSGDNAGYTVPQDYWVNFQVALKAFGGVLSGAKLLETEDGRQMPWPTTDPTTFVGHIVANELTAESPITPLTVGQGMLNAWTYTPGGPILISNQLIQDSAFDVVGFVQERTAEAIGRALAANAVSGTGSSQPLGVYPAITTKGAWSAGASGGFINLTAATTVKTFAASNPTELAGNILHPQSIVNMVQAIDPAYYPNAKFYFNAAQAWNLRTVVDSNGRPIIDFQDGFDADSVTGPNYNSNAPVARLFGFPVVIDNNLSNLTASTVSGPIFGDLSRALVYRSVREMQQYVLKERYADSLATAVYTAYRADVRSNDVRALVGVKPAAT